VAKVVRRKTARRKLAKTAKPVSVELVSKAAADEDEVPVINITAEEAVAQMNPALRKVYDILRKRVIRSDRELIMAHWDVGDKIASVSQNESKYGEHATEKLAAAMNIAAADLRKLRKLVRCYSRERIELICDRAEKAQMRLTLTHFFRLAALEEEKPSVRGQIEKEMISAKLTTDELQRKIAEVQGGATTPTTAAPGGARRGRKRAAPRSPIAGLAQICFWRQQLADQQAVWAEHIFGKIESTPPDSYDDSLLEKLMLTCDELQEASKAVDKLLGQTQDAVKRIKKVLKKKSSTRVPKSDRVTEDEPAVDEEEEVEDIVEVVEETAEDDVDVADEVADDVAEVEEDDAEEDDADEQDVDDEDEDEDPAESEDEEDEEDDAEEDEEDEDEAEEPVEPPARAKTVSPATQPETQSRIAAARARIGTGKTARPAPSRRQ